MKNKPSNVSKAKVDKKLEQLLAYTQSVDGTDLTTNLGVGISDNQNSLKAGTRGPNLLEDFILREKITHFDHERIPERIVHARGAAAHGYFQVYKPLAELSSAHFLQDPTAITPVFVRFSTVAGSRGSADTVRDVRGFAVKFYTEQGNFDLVGNNIPVFFVQDAIKFPDLIHAVKPEPHNEIPQAASAHSTFWDFVSLMPESLHMIMWAMSDRAIPRSYRMMEGFGIHTFRLVNAAGKSRFVKFHWKPMLGVHSLVWDEVLKIAGQDPDFNRRDLWECIEKGDYPEWEFGIQVIEEDEIDQFDFDVLDPTKLIPEELVPVQRIGKLVLNRNPANFFAETEQVAFCPANIVPGIDFSEDPLLQGRLFSYQDTQLLRLGGPNFAEIPINRPVCPMHNMQRDGHMRQTIDSGRVAYEPNSLAGGSPRQNSDITQAFASSTRRINAEIVRARSPSFADHFTQATLFWASQSAVEQQHIVDALTFELTKVDVPYIRERVVRLLANIDEKLAHRVAINLAIEVSTDISYLKESTAPLPNNRRGAAKPGKSAALSMAHTLKNSIATRKVAILAADGYEAKSLMVLQKLLVAAHGYVEIVSTRLGAIAGTDNTTVTVDKTLTTASSVMYDAVFIAAGAANVKVLAQNGYAVQFIKEAYEHFKPIAAFGESIYLLQQNALPVAMAGIANKEKLVSDHGVVSAQSAADVRKFGASFIEAIAQHRHWERTAIPLDA